jgi:hypothetical protein
MLVEAAPNAIVLADAEGRILLVNAETERLFGYSRQELLWVARSRCWCPSDTAALIPNSSSMSQASSKGTSICAGRLSTLPTWSPAARRPLIEQRRQQLLIQPPAEPLWVDGDLIRLSQVVANLLTNAAKYSPEQARIVLSASKEGAEACLRVSDEGIGIAPELLPRVFDLFVQGETSLARRWRPPDRADAGVRVVQLHGGWIIAYSAGRGRGSEFSVWLPLGEKPPVATASAPRTVPSAARLENPRRVLVVDDNADMAERSSSAPPVTRFERPPTGNRPCRWRASFIRRSCCSMWGFPTSPATKSRASCASCRT